MNAKRTTILGISTIVFAVATCGCWHPGGTRVQAAVRGDATSTPTQPKAVDGTSKSASSQARAAFTGQSLTPEQAHEEFNLSAKCYYAQFNAIYFRNAANSCGEMASKEANPADAINCRLIEQDFAGEAMDPQYCPDITAIARHFYEVTKAAAAVGDRDAQVCYIRSTFWGIHDQMPFTKQDIDDYLRDAPRYVADGLARGDWRVVSLLTAHGATDEYRPVMLLTKGDDYQAYVMNRLLQLGAEGDYAKTLGYRINGIFLSPRMNEGPLISPEQAAQGIKEAQDLFHRFFERQPPLKDEPRTCTST